MGRRWTMHGGERPGGISDLPFDFSPAPMMRWTKLEIQVRVPNPCSVPFVHPPQFHISYLGHFCCFQLGPTSFLGTGRLRSSRRLISKSLCFRRKQLLRWRWQGVGEKRVPGIWGIELSPQPLVFQIYNSSLEDEFNHFEDWVSVFPLYRGQGIQDGDGEEAPGHFVGKFKVCVQEERDMEKDK